MKTQNKSSNLTAVFLLVLSALFSISLLLQPFDFGAMGPGKDNLFYKLGKMLYSVYGFSSILIPIFLMIAGLSCFSAKWTARKTMRLLTALIPFFTCVITENICRSIIKYSGSSFSAIKLIVAIVTGVMMMVIEFLGIGIIADKIQQKHFGGNRDENSKKNIKLPRIKISGKNNSEQKNMSANDSVNESNQDLNDEEKDDKKPAINPIFDEVFNDSSDNIQDSQSPEETTISEQKDDGENAETSNVEQESPVEAENQQETEFEPETQTSMITQEEFAALTAAEDDNDSPVDELEWNLPPQPETLPPEYDEYFDVDEKALEFPPQDDDTVETSQNNLSFNENDEEIEEFSGENGFQNEDEFVESSEKEDKINEVDQISLF